MKNEFNARMEAQREILREINQIDWSVEPLLSLSEPAITRWVITNRLGTDDSIVGLVRQAGDALLFLANRSQEQVSPEYESHTADVASILLVLRNAVRDRKSRS